MKMQAVKICIACHRIKNSYSLPYEFNPGKIAKKHKMLCNLRFVKEGNLDETL
jgi:hypothetical protein